MISKTYLGDGVYAQIQNGMVLLTVEDGVETTDMVFLEDAVLVAFEKFIQRARDAATAGEI